MTLAHDVTGDGPPVVLLHSTAADRRMWDPQVPALAAAGFRVLRCDLRGYGESPVPAGSWDDARDLPDFHEIAVTLAARIPDAHHLALDWAGHLPNLERPAAVNTLLLDFLAR